MSFIHNQGWPVLCLVPPSLRQHSSIIPGTDCEPETAELTTELAKFGSELAELTSELASSVTLFSMLFEHALQAFVTCTASSEWRHMASHP